MFEQIRRLLLRKAQPGNLAQKQRQPEDGSGVGFNRREVLKIAASAGAMGLNSAAIGPMFGKIIDDLSREEGSKALEIDNSTERKEREFQSELLHFLHEYENEIASQWAIRTGNTDPDDDQLVTKMRAFYKARLSQSASLISDHEYQQMLTIHATYNILGLRDETSTPVSFETDQSSELRAFAHKLKHEPLVDFQSVVRSTYLYYVLSEFGYHLSGLRVN